MPVGSHKDAFKAHQLVKKLMGSQPQRVLAAMAADILLDFVKNQRQICAGAPPERLPDDSLEYEGDKLDAALVAVDSLCGKCEESHDNACFVNQARRALITAKTGVDLGTQYDGKKKLDELVAMAQAMATKQSAAPPSPAAVPASSAPEGVGVMKDDAGELKRQLDQYRERDVFRATLTDEIVSTIEAVSRGDFAAEMPIHEDEQLGKLASTFNLMLKAINQTVKNLDLLVEERSKELRMIMNSVPSGILSIDEQCRIKPEYSRSAGAILGLDDLRGRDFFDTLGLTRRREAERAKLQEFLDIFRQALIPEADMAGLDPYPELELPARESRASTWVKLSYHLLSRGEGKPNHILVTLEDISRQKELSREAERTGRENTHLRAIAEDPDLFRDFLAEMRKVLAETAEILPRLKDAPDERQIVNEVYRGVHTIKGVAASMGLQQVVDLTGQIEERLGALRDGGEVTVKLQAETKETLERLAVEREAMQKSATKLLGEEQSDDGDVHLRVSLRELKRREAAVRELDLDAKVSGQILGMLATLKELPARHAFSRVVKMIPGLAQRLGRNVRLRFDGAEIPVDCEVAKELNTALLHLIRNAMDHGIESPAARVDAGKPEQAELALRVTRSVSELVVRVDDDGRGMDPEKLRKAAVSKGLLTADEAKALSREECLGLIYRPGFSTAEAVTDVSGRGVGMDAVLAAVREGLGGRIEIDSVLGKGTSVTLRLPLGMKR